MAGPWNQTAYIARARHAGVQSMRFKLQLIRVEWPVKQLTGLS